MGTRDTYTKFLGRVFHKGLELKQFIWPSGGWKGFQRVSLSVNYQGKKCVMGNGTAGAKKRRHRKAGLLRDLQQLIRSTRLGKASSGRSEEDTEKPSPITGLLISRAEVDRTVLLTIICLATAIAG